MASPTTLPLVSSSSVVLVEATPEERISIVKATHPHWGTAFPNIDDYIAREVASQKAPLSRNNGLTVWMLTDGSLPPGERPLLSSCETYKKRALYTDKNGGIKEGISHGVASVYTPHECRGKGYAGKMMVDLAELLRTRQQKKDGDAIFSVLWSDIGRKFYTVRGWKPFESAHLAFSANTTETAVNPNLRTITEDDLPALAARDEKLLHKQLSALGDSSKHGAVVLPDLETFLWHYHREDFMCEKLLSRTPKARGAVYTPPGAPNSRIWALWARNYYGGIATPEKNTMYILRHVVEDESISDETLAEGLNAIMTMAQAEAKEWICTKLELWNPSERVKKAIEGIPALDAKFVERENDSVPSLLWFGQGSTDNVEWFANEKFAWC